MLIETIKLNQEYLCASKLKVLVDKLESFTIPFQ